MSIGVRNWITASDFAFIAAFSRISASNALRACHAGGTWRGHRLIVRIVRGRGGAAGKSYEVRLGSLPPELQAKWYAENGRHDLAAVPVIPEDATRIDPGRGTATAGDWERRLEMIRPALVHPAGSQERAKTIAAIARASGQSDRNIRRMISKYETRGINGLAGKVRSDKRTARVFISRRWDKAFPLDRDTQDGIARAVIGKTRSLWAGGAPGRAHVQRLASAELARLTAEALGDGTEPATILEACTVPRRIVERERSHRLIVVKDRDAKAFFDFHTPRTRRDRSTLLPMQVVAGDVHHFDVLVRREDGSVCTPKLIAWQDLATNRLFATTVFLELRRGIRQEHVVASFIEVTEHPEWGMPGALYLDNGGEYKALGFIDDAMKLAALPGFETFAVFDGTADAAAGADRRSMIVKSRPYNAPGKIIESAFAALEHGPFAMLPGWIGGNRMRKKTHNVGREPTPYPGSQEEFRADVGKALAYYHTTPQSGHLAGKSPAAAFAALVEAGWRRTDIDRAALEAAFARETTRVVHQGEITIDGRRYRHDALLTRSGDRVTVRVPIVGDKERPAVIDASGTLICIAEPTPVFGLLDPAGAKDKGRRQSKQNRMIREMRRDTEPVDLVAEMDAAAALHPDPPAVESAGVIRLADGLETEAALRRSLPAPGVPQRLRENKTVTALLEHREWRRKNG